MRREPFSIQDSHWRWTGPFCLKHIGEGPADSGDVYSAGGSVKQNTVLPETTDG
jgi:hypothetical protein